MKTLNYIPKNKKLVPAEDYAFLRKKGLEHIEKLSANLWTDYNVHDPGITIMEVLCYAISDIAYRNSFDIKDILTRQDGTGGIDELFTARQILTVNPVSLNDFRKVLIDIEGVKNAWLEVLDKQDQAIYVDCKESALTFENPDNDLDELKIRGFYDVILELDEDIVHGDLNDYGLEDNYDNIDFSFNLPAWDYFFRNKLNPEDWSFSSYTYIAYTPGTKIHDIAVDLINGAETLTLQGSFVIAGSRNLDREDTVKSYLSGAGAAILTQRYLEKVGKALAIAQEAFKTLHAKRNLCEDYNQLKAISTEDISVCTEIIIRPDAEIEEVHAQILFEIQHFLAPDVKFYSLIELQAEKYPTDSIFNGPALNHGFIKAEELKASEFKTEIYVSDLINIIMDIDGVEAVKDIQIASSFNGVPIQKGEKWILPVTSGRAPRLEPDSDMTFYKGVIPYFSDKWKLKQYLKQKNDLIRAAKLKEDEYDIEAPEGKYYDLADYTSVQEDLPLVYGTSRLGIPGVVDDKRKAQSKQLKAYLTLFDQLLANYVAQTRQLSQLLSMDGNVDKSYFYELLYKLPDATTYEGDYLRENSPEIYKLLKSFTDTLANGTDIDLYKSYQSTWEAFTGDIANDYIKNLAAVAESKETFLDRRNRFLDHLMGRFCEQFTDYVMLMYKLDRAKAPQELIDDKVAFLNDYPLISSERGKAFNYTTCANIWKDVHGDGSNVSGYVKRLARLTGIAAYERQQLHCPESLSVFDYYRGVDEQWYFRVGKPGDVIIGSEGYTSRASSFKGIRSVINNGVNIKNFRFLDSSDGRHYFNIKARNGEIIGTSPMFENREERDLKISELQELLLEECQIEGFHLVEHLLLTPPGDSYNLFPVCIDPGCNTCLGFRDPYSFRMTLVLPAWVERFANIDFRRHFEYTARMEAPAHVHVKICWVDIMDMRVFEEAYLPWLEAKCSGTLTPTIHNNMVSALNELNSVYPEATLHDCREDDGDNPLILGQTMLGSTK